MRRILTEIIVITWWVPLEKFLISCRTGKPRMSYVLHTFGNQVPCCRCAPSGNSHPHPPKLGYIDGTHCLWSLPFTFLTFLTLPKQKWKGPAQFSANRPAQHSSTLVKKGLKTQPQIITKWEMRGMIHLTLSKESSDSAEREQWEFIRTSPALEWTAICSLNCGSTASFQPHIQLMFLT